MAWKNLSELDSPYIGCGALTREQFLFHEMRATAKLYAQGLSKEEIVNRIVDENIFQFPTEKSIRNIANACIRRLNTLDDEYLVKAIADEPSDIAKQVCLYAMMKHYRLISDFMLAVIGEKYRLKDTSFSKADINIFFLRLQEQDDYIAALSDSTINKIRQVINKMLVDTEYIDDLKSDRLNPVLISSILEDAIRDKGDTAVLIAFNCFG